MAHEHDNAFEQQHLNDWVGSTISAGDVIDANRCHRLIASLGLERCDLSQGAPLPILWHWLYFLESTELSAPVRGGFLPPVPLRRRMFAGGRTDIHAPLRVGMQVQRTSTVEKVEHKVGTTGELVIVVVRNTITSHTELLIDERQHLIYTDASPSTNREAPQPVSATALSRDIKTDEVMLFRFSALTFNSHRIHYDRKYAQNQEGYRDLVVHGPLTAVCLADAANGSSVGPIASFEFRARAPFHVGETIRIRGERKGSTIDLRAYRDDGMCVMTASAGF